MIFYKIHSSPEAIILAIADSDLIGKNINGFIISENFYKGEKITREKLQTLINTCTSINITGKKSISLLREVMDIPEKLILQIEGIPHCTIYKF